MAELIEMLFWEGADFSHVVRGNFVSHEVQIPLENYPFCLVSNVRRILVKGSTPPYCLRRRKFWRFDYEMVHFEVYLKKYVVSI